MKNLWNIMITILIATIVTSQAFADFDHEEVSLMNDERVEVTQFDIEKGDSMDSLAQALSESDMGLRDRIKKENKEVSEKFEDWSVRESQIIEIP